MDNDDVNEDEEGKSVGGKKKLIFIVAAILLLSGVGAGLYFGGIIGGGDKNMEQAEELPAPEHGSGHGDNSHAEQTAKGAPIYYELPEFLTNLNTNSRKPSFLKMRVTLELEGKNAVKVVDRNKPKIVDAFNTYLREMRASDLAGSAGIYRLREELLARTGTIVAPVKVKDILFGEFIVQ